MKEEATHHMTGSRARKQWETGAAFRDVSLVTHFFQLGPASKGSKIALSTGITHLPHDSLGDILDSET